MRRTSSWRTWLPEDRCYLIDGVDLSGGYRHHEFVGSVIRQGQAAAVKPVEGDNRRQGEPLVSVDQGMVASDRWRRCCSLAVQVRVGVLPEYRRLRPRHRSFEQAIITHRVVGARVPPPPLGGLDKPGERNGQRSVSDHRAEDLAEGRAAVVSPGERGQRARVLQSPFACGPANGLVAVELRGRGSVAQDRGQPRPRLLTGLQADVQGGAARVEDVRRVSGQKDAARNGRRRLGGCCRRCRRAAAASANGRSAPRTRRRWHAARPRRGSRSPRPARRFVRARPGRDPLRRWS